MLSRKQQLEILAIASLKRGRLWRYNENYIAALYGVSHTWISVLMRRAGIGRTAGTGETYKA